MRTCNFVGSRKLIPIFFRPLSSTGSPSKAWSKISADLYLPSVRAPGFRSLPAASTSVTSDSSNWQAGLRLQGGFVSVSGNGGIGTVNFNTGGRYTDGSMRPTAAAAISAYYCQLSVASARCSSSAQLIQSFCSFMHVKTCVYLL